MVHAKNYETAFKFVKVMQRRIWTLFQTQCIYDRLQAQREQHDMDTEVVIWSSKVQHSPSPSPSNHAPWTTRALYEQPEVGWMPQREPEPLPLSNEVEFSTVTSFDRCAECAQ